ncbi:MAG: aminotransferase class V-fold PLP-dependent enzyme [Fimbriimonadaceae bacterium]
MGAGLAVFRDDTFLRIGSLLRGSVDPEDEKFWEELRSAFDLDSELMLMNNVGLSPAPKRVIEIMEEESRRAGLNPSYRIWRQQDRELDEIRSDLADLVGCESDEIALTPNSTYALQTVIMGIEMERGDEILSTSHDYPRVHTAINQRANREGIVPVVVDLGSHALTPEELVSRILGAITPRTKLVVLSQISYLIGQLLPVSVIAKELRVRGVPFLLDSAQATGLLPEKISELDCPLIATCFHKWLMGPIGTGMLVVQKESIPSIWPLHPADATMIASIKKFEQIGTRPAAPLLALRESLRFHRELGYELKAKRLDFLRRQIASHFIELPGVRHYGSLDPSICFPMLTVGFDKAATTLVASHLLSQHKVHVTTAVRAGVDGIRISPSLFTRLDEADRLGKILAKIAQEGI